MGEEDEVDPGWGTIRGRMRTNPSLSTLKPDMLQWVAMPRQKEKIHPTFFEADIFANISRDEIVQISDCFKLREFKRNEYLFHEDQPASTFYIVMEGKVKILQTSAAGFEVILHVLGEKELLGALPMLGKGTYPAGGQALTDVLAYAIADDDFDSLLSAYNPMCINMLRFATHVLQNSLVKIREMATERVEQRIARTLTRLVEQVGKETPEGILLDAPISRQELAEMTGTTVFTVSRTLKSWERNNIIELGREKVVIKQQHDLVAIADALFDEPT